MHDAMLIIHFIGLAMGLGTALGYVFLGIAGSKMEESRMKTFMIDVMPLSYMGHAGITLLILSGGYLMNPYWSNLGEMPLLIAKLVLVLVLLVSIIVIARTGSKAKKTGDMTSYFNLASKMGKVNLISALAIVVLAVLVFH